MPRLTFISKYKLVGRQILSSEEVKNLYLYGIKLEKDGVTLPDEVIDNQVLAASTMLEDYLHIKFNRTAIKESRDFIGDDWQAWNFMKLSYPIQCIVGMEGYKGTTRQVIYPKSWLSVRINPSDKVASRLLYMVPNQNSQTNEQLVFSGIMPNLSMYGYNKQIPNYWQIRYVTGFKEIPNDIKFFIGKFAAINTLVLANSFLQKTPGVASESLSLDGLSQTTSISIQQGIFASTIKTFTEDLKNELTRLFDVYAAVNMITA